MAAQCPCGLLRGAPFLAGPDGADRRRGQWDIRAGARDNRRRDEGTVRADRSARAIVDELVDLLGELLEIDGLEEDGIDPAGPQIVGQPRLDDAGQDDDDGPLLLFEQVRAEPMAVAVGHAEVGDDHVIMFCIDEALRFVAALRVSLSMPWYERAIETTDRTDCSSSTTRPGAW